MKKQLKITFVDIVDKIDLKTYLITRALLEKYDLKIDNNNPDLAICDMWGLRHIDVEVPKIYFSLETYIFANDFYDIYIGGCDLGAGKIQWNTIVEEMYFPQIQNNKYIGNIKKYRNIKKTKFCAFLYKNYHARERIQFCKKLMKYKFVDCLGSVLNNTKLDKTETRYVSDWDDKAMNIYKDYKFVIAFENSSSLGYISEKILLPLSVGSIPIYWGAPDVKDYINPECFINVNDFDSFEDCIEYVKKVDNDDELYQKYINAKPILASSKLHNMTYDKLKKWLLPNVEKILSSNYKPIGKLSGYKRLKAIWLKRYWKYKQTVLYRFDILLEKIGIK